MANGRPKWRRIDWWSGRGNNETHSREQPRCLACRVTGDEQEGVGPIARLVEDDAEPRCALTDEIETL